MTAEQEPRRRAKQDAASSQGTASSPIERIDPTASNVKSKDDMSIYPGAISRAAAWMHTMLPELMQAGVMMGLIFGGCCSNVFALEAIVKSEPDSGLLITFTQFLLVALTGYYDHFSASHPPFYLQPNRVPLLRWAFYVLLFFGVNILNNYAFGFNISVPVHIILRSGGSVTTMAVGWLWGKRYSRMQVVSVVLLTIGVVLSATADTPSQQGKPSSKRDQSTRTHLTGLSIIFVAQVLSAVMGLYMQRTYETYGTHWRESLFYSHLLGLPLFIPFYPSLQAQMHQLASSPPIFLSAPHISKPLPPSRQNFGFLAAAAAAAVGNPPRHLVALAANALTQYVCIRGVNRLAARASALTVTIVLNIRKLVSLLLSIWLFGNHLANGVLLGATVVFGSGALYAWESQRLSSRRRRPSATTTMSEDVAAAKNK